MHISHKTRFTDYQDSVVLLKSRQYAKWTLPQMMVDSSTVTLGQAQAVERDYQEVGALLTNNLGAKLAGILFPASRPFYKINSSAELRATAAAKGVTDADLAAGLAKLEVESSQRIFINASYNQIVTAIKHLIITGNVLLYRDAQHHKTVAYGLNSFGVRRDGLGHMIDCVLRENTSYRSLSPEIQNALRMKHASKYSKERTDSKDCNVELYTRIERKYASAEAMHLAGAPYYEVTQEAEDIPVGTAGTYPDHLCPFQAPVWSLVAGEHYGRGLVEDYAGGFAKLSDTSHALALYGIEALKVVNLVAPGSGVDIDELQKAETGEYVVGTRDAVQAHETGSINKLQAALAIIQDLFTNLSKAFMYKGSTRNAERVTATELRMDAQEAEATLGGVYSALAESMQIPFANLLLTEVSPDTLQGLVSKDIKLNIIAGIPALGRATDVQNLLEAAQEIAAIVPVFVQMDKRVDPQRVVDMILAGRSVDASLLYKDKQQLAEEAAAATQVQQGQGQVANADAMAAQAQQLQTLTTQ